MMNTRAALLTILLAAVGFGAGSAFALNLASIDMEEVFQGYYKTARSQAALKKQEQIYEEHAKRVMGEMESVKKERDELQERSLNIGLSDEVRSESRKKAEEKDEEYQERKKELKKFMMGKKKELRQQYLERRNQLVKEITEYVNTYAEEQNLDLILDASGMSSNMIPLVVYSAETLDITETILSKLNKGHEDEVTEAQQEAPLLEE